jgi:PAS domain-containing protein/CheY-like chemotaxis protein
MARGEPAWYENALVPIHRNGRLEEVFWTYSYSPAYDDSGQIYGTLVIVTEMTARVLLARRLDVLSRLGSSLSTADSHDAILDALGRISVSCPEDVPFLAIYEHDLADPVRCFRIDRQALKRLLGPRSPSGKSEMVEFAGDVHGSVWPEPIRMGFATAVGARPYHLLFGLSPRLPVDHGYRSYLAQIGEQAASALDRIDNASISIATERQRNNLLQQAPVATALMTGPTHIFQLANPLYCRLVGRDPVGKSYFEAFPERRDTEFPGILDRVYRTGEPYAVSEMPVPLVRSSSGALEDCFINFNLEALRDQDGVVFGMMAVAIDVTEQVRARKVLEKSDAERQIVMARLEETSRSKDEFLAMLGHELRNPLAPILTALELMAHKDQEKASARERAVIERQVRHMVRLVDDLLDISRITSRAVTLPDCTLIALTGYGPANNNQRARDAGFNAHLVKPAKVAQLLDLITCS